MAAIPLPASPPDSPDAPPEVVAETIGRVLRDPGLKEKVLKRQDERIARFRARDEWAELRVLLGV